VATVLINQSQGYLGQWAAADALDRAGKLVSAARTIEPTAKKSWSLLFACSTTAIAGMT